MNNREQSMSDALRMAGSPAGQQLIRLLKEQGDQNVLNAMEKVAAGDFSQVGIIIKALMENPEARSLLQQLGGNHGKHGR